MMQVEFENLYEQNHLDLLNEEEINLIIKKNKVDTNLISDGYHTFSELYEHRSILYIALCKLAEKDNKLIWRSNKHSDGSEWDGWFLLGINDKRGEQITYHLPSRFWDACEFAYTKEVAPECDGHTSEDALQRLSEL